MVSKVIYNFKLMKYIFVFLAVFLFNCNNDKKDVTSNKEDTVTERVDTIQQETPLEIYDFAGVEKYLNYNDDKTYIVNFWATWCAPCVKELPYFEKIGADYKSEDVEVILVSLDFPKHYESKLKPFIAEKKLQSKMIVLNDVDSNSWIPKVNENWSGAIPATLIYNNDKRHFYEQSFSYEELETELKQFLK